MYFILFLKKSTDISNIFFFIFTIIFFICLYFSYITSFNQKNNYENIYLSKGNQILSIRAAYDTIHYNEIIPLILTFTPFFNENLLEENFTKNATNRVISSYKNRNYFLRNSDILVKNELLILNDKKLNKSDYLKVIISNFEKH